MNESLMDGRMNVEGMDGWMDERTNKFMKIDQQTDRQMNKYSKREN